MKIKIWSLFVLIWIIDNEILSQGYDENHSHVHRRHDHISGICCSDASMTIVQNIWHNFWRHSSDRDKLEAMDDVLTDIRKRYPESIEKFVGLSTSTDTSVTGTRKDLSKHLLEKVNDILNIITSPEVLRSQLDHCFMTDQYVGGGNAELLMLVVGSLATLLPQSSSSVDIEAWAECMKGIGKSVADSLRSLSGSSRSDRGAVCSMTSSDPSISGTLFFKQRISASHVTMQTSLSLSGAYSSYSLSVHEFGILEDYCALTGAEYAPLLDGIVQSNLSVPWEHNGEVPGATLIGSSSVIGRSAVLHGFSGGAWHRVGCCTLDKYSAPLLNQDHHNHVHHWTYQRQSHKGPSQWYHDHSSCGGSRQSPIDLSSTSRDANYNPISFLNYNEPTEESRLLNNGHTLKVGLSGSMTIQDGGLSGTYQAIQLHFHWGGDNNVGSEHTINSNAYPLEMHIVHIKHGLTVQEALRTSDGLAVIAVLYHIQGYDNTALSPIIDYFHYAHLPGSNTVIPSLTLSTLLPVDRSDFFRYEGSLTTPPCSEAVIWTVLHWTVGISVEQMSSFRTLMDDQYVAMVNNYRPLQLIADRNVYCNQ